MGTAQRPWGSFDNPMAAMMRIGFSDSTPPVPSNVSESCQSFIRDCVQRDLGLRPSSVDLLNHPFVPTAIVVQLFAELAEDGMIIVNGATIDGASFATLRTSCSEC